MDFRIIIPARYHSERLPGKPLIDLGGKPMIQHVYERSVASGADSVVVATDDERIATAVKKFNGKVCMTSSDHQTGTDRIAEACTALDYDEDDIIVGVQGDEPLIPPEVIKQLAEDLNEHDNVKVSSVCTPIKSPSELFDSSVVKVILNHRNYAIYFSRAPIPWERAEFNQEDKTKIKLSEHHYRHIGLYAYRAGFLSDYISWNEAPIERLERLEQLRILWHGGRIHMVIGKKAVPSGVDLPEDVERVRALLAR